MAAVAGALAGWNVVPPSSETPTVTVEPKV